MVPEQPTKTFTRIFDNGQVLAETLNMGQLLPASAFPKPAAEPGNGADYRSEAGRSYRVQSVGHSGTIIQVAMDRSLEAEILGEYRKHLWLVLSAALVVCSAVSFQIARRGIRPIHRVTETARRVQPANLGERIAIRGLPSELLILANTFNQMLDRLEQSFTQLSRFSADIAHELRTPVNNLRGEIEVALETPHRR